MRWCLSPILCAVALHPAYSQTPTKVVKPDGNNVVSSRDPRATVAAINRAWRSGLEAAKTAPAGEADDAEFVRRVCLDLTGQIPSARRSREFLDSRDPEKRRALVDDLLNNPGYGKHFGISWRLWFDPPEDGGKPKPDILTPWLAQQFQRNRGLGEIVRELITAQGEIRNNGSMSFLIANSESFRPKPEMLADAVSRTFMGVELRCAQCHDHPFADWKQDEFWGLAAFFSRVHPTSFKGGPNVSLLESDALPDGEKADERAQGAALTVPAMFGPKSGKVVRARFPKGVELATDKPMPYRNHLADWLVAAENPYFARATVNRFWFLLFGRGLVNPLDGFDAKNPPANPALLDVLARAFAESGYEVKHLLRCICLSEPYQRTSRSEGQPADDPLNARMAVKPFTPEMLYDSISVLLQPEPADKTKPAKPTGGTPPMKPTTPAGGKPPAKPTAPLGGKAPVARDEFVKYFRARGGNLHAVNQGIPQALRLLNDPTVVGDAPVIERLVGTKFGREEAIETLFLAAYSRKPSASEVALFERYLAKQPDERAGYGGMLWILLNSSEFLLNH